MLNYGECQIYSVSEDGEEHFIGNAKDLSDTMNASEIKIEDHKPRITKSSMNMQCEIIEPSCPYLLERMFTPTFYGLRECVKRLVGETIIPDIQK